MSEFNDIVQTVACVFSAIGIGIACLMGLLTKTINERKGYYGGFAWGFWLGLIGVIVVSCKPDNTKSKYSDLSRYNADNEGNPKLSGGNWKCAFCDRSNPSYKSLCDCGRTQNETYERTRRRDPVPKRDMQEIKLDGAKRMFEDGIITKQEYEDKKKAILKEVKTKEENKSVKSATERQLENVQKMLEDGLITQEEYEVKRRIILGI